jgi:hypothetical protein
VEGWHFPEERNVHEVQKENMVNVFHTGKRDKKEEQDA